jgi:hypothetical protein
MPVFMREYLTSANRPSAFFLGLTLAEVPYQVRPSIDPNPNLQTK